MISTHLYARPLVLSYLIVSLASLVSQTASAETRIHPDYIAIAVEAEDFDASAIDGHDARWTLTDPTTPQTDQDPDGNNSDGAVGNQYLELLPDVRVRHEDPFGPPTAYWGARGTGPTLQYPIDFPEAGRYYVHARANSSGTEDNGIHVGLNGDWPLSGFRMQWCTGGQGWQWSSRQRASGGAGDCGVDFTIWLDVEQAGMNTVMFSAREDGFELDRFMLIKDKSDSTRICRAGGENLVTCRDGFIETLDNFVDVAVSIDTDRVMGIEDDVFTFNVEVANEDGFDTAQDVILTSPLNLGEDWELISASDPCFVVGTDLRCELGNIEPTQPGEDQNLSFSVRALTTGGKEISAQVSTSSSDESAQNDIAALTVTVERLIVYTTLESTISMAPLEPKVLDEIDVTIMLENTGSSLSENTLVSVDLPTGIAVMTLAEGCTRADALTCNVGNIQPGESGVVALQLTTDVEGIYPISVQRSADNLAEGSVTEFFTVDVLSAEESIETSETVEPVDPMDLIVPTEPDEINGSPTNPDNIDPQANVETVKTSGGALHWLSLLYLLAPAVLRASRTRQVMKQSSPEHQRVLGSTPA